MFAQLRESATCAPTLVEKELIEARFHVENDGGQGRLCDQWSSVSQEALSVAELRNLVKSDG